MKTNGSMTIYNKVFDPVTRGDKWQRNVVSKVFWNSTRSTTLSKGLVNNSACTVYIPTSDWTVQPGDLIVKGVVYDEISKQSDLESKYDEVYVVSNATINNYGSPGMRHIEVSGI